jgi:NAD(P)H-flavin reductase
VAEPPTPYRVSERRRETHDTWTLRLEPEDSTPLEPFAPGQFAMLYAFGIGEAPISVGGIDGAALVHTIRDVGPVTHALSSAEPGERVGVRGPFGTTWPLAQAEGCDVLLVAGGLGLAPLRPVLGALRAEPHRYGRVDLLYGSRSPADLLYADELPALGARVIVDTAPAGWPGRVGVVTRLLREALFDPARTVAMICGPEVMMRFAAADLRDLGVPDHAIWLALERGMQCGLGHCGHCQLGPLFVCKDGPVVRHDTVEPYLKVAEL